MLTSLTSEPLAEKNGICGSAPSLDCRWSPKLACVCVCPEPEGGASESDRNVAAELSEQPHTDLGERFPRLVKLLSDVPSVQQLLRQAARRTLDDLEQQVEEVSKTHIVSLEVIGRTKHIHSCVCLCVSLCVSAVRTTTRIPALRWTS